MSDFPQGMPTSGEMIATLRACMRYEGAISLRGPAIDQVIRLLMKLSDLEAQASAPSAAEPAGKRTFAEGAVPATVGAVLPSKVLSTADQLRAIEVNDSYASAVLSKAADENERLRDALTKIAARSHWFGAHVDIANAALAAETACCAKDANAAT